MNQTAEKLTVNITQDISIETLYELWCKQDPNAVILDIRSEEDHRSGHVPGSRNIPFASVMERSDELKGYSQIFIHCYGGQGSTSIAANLAEVGFENICYVGQAGMKDWQAKGYPVEA